MPKVEVARAGSRRTAPPTRRSQLGTLLGDLRKAKRLSLREVEEATGRSVSNAYLSQLENGKIAKPSKDLGPLPKWVLRRC